MIGDSREGRRPSGLEVFILADLSSSEQTVDDLAWTAGKYTALSLVVAVLLALLAARGVLRPVRELRTAARQLAAGELDTRLRVRGKDELADLVLTFNNTAADLERSVSDLRRMETNARRFVADVSHELRTPLAAMTAVTDTLDEEAADLQGDAGTAARMVSTETRRLVQLVENLIEISRFDAGRAVLRIDDVDVAEAVTATIAARGWADDVEADLPDGVVASIDRRRLDVIVANLVGNALRHGGSPVTVTLGTEPGTDGARWVTITVTDRGPGLPPEIAPHVFDRFYKADAARSRSEGSGLGLSIAMENARLHHGTIEAVNRSSGGARFILRLPCQQPVGAAAAL
jgi:two-component system sensor histidine kinase MtrB